MWTNISGSYMNLPRSIPMHGPFAPPPRTQNTAFWIGDSDDIIFSSSAASTRLWSCCSRLLPNNPILCRGRFKREGWRHDDDDSLEDTASVGDEKRARYTASDAVIKATLLLLLTGKVFMVHSWCRLCQWTRAVWIEIDFIFVLVSLFTFHVEIFAFKNGSGQDDVFTVTSWRNDVLIACDVLWL